MAIAQVFRGLPGGTALNMPPFAQVPPHRIPQDRDVVIVSSGSPAPLLRLPVAHEGRHAAGELSPVRVQPAAPAGGEPGEQPGVPFARPVTGTLLLARMALARPLQLDVADKVTAERGPPGFLNVEEHYNIIPLDVEIYSAIKVFGGEIKARHESNQSTVLGAVRVSRTGSVHAIPASATSQSRGQ